MTQNNEPHAVVRLLIARMESHPEEFKVADASFHDRWYHHVHAVNTYGNEADNAALNAKLRDIRMAETHERVMDELLNGPERRRKEEEEREYERSLMMQQAQRNTYSQQTLQNAYANQLSQLGQYAQAGGGGASLPVSTSPYQNAAGAQGLVGNQGSFNAGLPVANGGTGITGKSATLAILDEYANIANTGTITSEPTLSPSAINQIKKALGIKK